MARAKSAISLGVSAVIIIVIILIVGFGVYLNDTFNTTSTIVNQTGTSDSQTTIIRQTTSTFESTVSANAFLFSFSLNANYVIQGQSTLTVQENLTNISKHTQTFEGAQAEAPTYFMYYSTNDSLACAFYNSAFDNYNFSIGAGQSLSFNAALPTYSYSSRSAGCNGIADASVDTYFLQVFSVWGYGTGTNITPIASANETINVIAPTQTVNASSTSQNSGETCTLMNTGNQTSVTETYLCHTEVTTSFSNSG